VGLAGLLHEKLDEIERSMSAIAWKMMKKQAREMLPSGEE
jgi:hypothetical protein